MELLLSYLLLLVSIFLRYLLSGTGKVSGTLLCTPGGKFLQAHVKAVGDTALSHFLPLP